MLMHENATADFLTYKTQTFAFKVNALEAMEDAQAVFDSVPELIESVVKHGVAVDKNKSIFPRKRFLLNMMFNLSTLNRLFKARADANEQLGGEEWLTQRLRKQQHAVVMGVY